MFPSAVAGALLTTVLFDAGSEVADAVAGPVRRDSGAAHALRVFVVSAGQPSG